MKLAKLYISILVIGLCVANIIFIHIENLDQNVALNYNRLIEIAVAESESPGSEYTCYDNYEFHEGASILICDPCSWKDDYRASDLDTDKCTY